MSSILTGLSKPCATCGASLEGRDQKRFCSKSCAAKTTNKERANPRFCATGCGEALPSKGPHTKCCSQRCANELKYAESVARWLSGHDDGIRCGGDRVANFVRRFVHERDGTKCCRCGWAEINPTTGKVPVQLEHKDGDATNNDPENLCLLCPNCHALTPSYGGLNRGRGKRRKKVFAPVDSH